MAKFQCNLCERTFDNKRAIIVHKRYHNLKFREKMSKILRGKKWSEQSKQKKREENNVNWKGDEVQYNALHEWIRNHKLKPEFCERCKKLPPYDLANISGKYKRDINDFEWLCRKCHMNGDGRISNLMKRERNEKGQFGGQNRNLH